MKPRVRWFGVLLWLVLAVLVAAAVAGVVDGLARWLYALIMPATVVLVLMGGDS